MTTREEYERRRMAVADYLIEHPDEFLMTCFGYKSDVSWTSRSGATVSCGTVGCIAGTAAFRAEEEGYLKVEWDKVTANAWMLTHVTVGDERVDIDTAASEYLGMSNGTPLFYDFSIATAEEAAKRLLDEPYAE